MRTLFLCMLLSAGLLRAAEAPAVALDGRPLDVAPRIRWAADVFYPPHLFHNEQKIQGYVALDLTLDPQAKVTATAVRVATHPAFIPPAIEAVLASKFEPGRIAGEAVAAKLPYRVMFYVKDLGGSIVQNLPAISPNKPANLPPEFDYDTPPVLAAFCEVVYPRDLQLAAVRGEAVGSFHIDAHGRVTAGQILSATHPDMGAALLAAVQSWHFVPAQRAGVAVGTVFVQKQEFGPGWQRPPDEQRALKKLTKDPEDLVEMTDLDVPLKRLYQVAPHYPPALQRNGVGGEAEIEFIVTRLGQAVLPAVTRATHPEFGWAAATAVAQWYYTQPKRKGRAVDVRVRMPFGFSMPARNEPPAPPAPDRG